MKKSKRFLMILLSVLALLSPCNVFAGKTLYDGFSTGHLDANLWWPREYTREIMDGKLETKLGNSDGMGAEITQGLFNNPLSFINPEPIHTIEAEVTIVETQIDSPGSYSAERVGGYFYNSNDSGGPTGDVFVHIKIGDFGNGGLEANWSAYKVISDEGTQQFIDGASLVAPGGINYSNAIAVKVSYDEAQTFTFMVNGQSDSFVGPERKRPAVYLNKGFATTILTQNSTEKGFIFAKIDNVRINNSPVLYDNFSSPVIDMSKWKDAEWVREASEGYLRANIIGNGSTKAVSTHLTQKDTPYLEAKVFIDSGSQLSPDTYGIGRIQGYYYNESRGQGSGQSHNKYEGDVFAQVRLRYNSDGTLSADAFVDRSNDENESDYTNLFSHKFSIPISLDTYYVVSIRFEGKKLIFSCAGETAEYNITTPTYPAYGEHRLLRSRVHLDPGETGYIKVRFDDVYIQKTGALSPGVPLLLFEKN